MTLSNHLSGWVRHGRPTGSGRGAGGGFRRIPAPSHGGNTGVCPSSKASALRATLTHYLPAQRAPGHGEGQGTGEGSQHTLHGGGWGRTPTSRDRLRETDPGTEQLVPGGAEEREDAQGRLPRGANAGPAGRCRRPPQAAPSTRSGNVETDVPGDREGGRGHHVPGGTQRLVGEDLEEGTEWTQHRRQGTGQSMSGLKEQKAEIRPVQGTQVVRSGREGPQDRVFPGRLGSGGCGRACGFTGCASW